MRWIFGLSALGLALAAPAIAQPSYPQPRGSYERLCTNIRMDGHMLSATCRGARGPAQSSINILSCSTEISVDAEGGLTCIGPGGGAPPAIRDAPPGFSVAPGRYDDRYGGRGDFRAETATVYGGRSWRGRGVRIDGATPNLDGSGLNDRVRSIRLERGSRPWVVCSDADFRGHCTTIDRSISDTRAIGMARSISSLRPAY